MPFAALPGGAGDAWAACRAALADGAPGTLDPAPVNRVATFHLLRRRERLTRRRGTRTLGFAAALAALEACAYDDVLLGRVRTATLEFQLVLSPDAAEIVACFGVARAAREDL
ncbi:hypothetical protein [Actinomadura rayongensis]|uniref:Uncharacterized protein n=1 Tax=Actinomadura rayongensis TaxID=1429076 RepID=A0A6I4W6Y0_9ACTN|nr:hypothetical protein [Actinomadura rayongensis]MXQ65328.1 hypothetical protein [Actinomadura rayongensis]